MEEDKFSEHVKKKRGCSSDKSRDRNAEKVGGDPILISSTLGPAAAAAECRWA